MKRISTFSEAALGQYVDLFEACYPGVKKFSREYLHWLYWGNPSGDVIGFDAWKGGDLAAHYAVIPLQYRLLSGEVVRACLSLNTATHPNHQRKGLFGRLAEITYNQALTDGCQAVFGVANAASTPGFLKKLGFSLIGRVRLGIGYRSSDFLPESRRTGVQLTPEHVAWRLANPNAHYLLQRSGDHLGVFLPRRFGTVFLGYVPESKELSPTGLGPRGLLPVALPWFGFSPGLAIPIPARWLPSPWNVIVRPLSGDVARFADGFTIVGLEMDSF